ncbi:hypothetical protein RR21198_3119 [Rhodococcus rhodochrous ATCC 21198]|uniref:hypothetical protein n=2 Tax=Rhodococcus aetherivorans TaxID=191292 RepID=UPI0003E1C56B|nr:hypothetical protein [Rhodococcus aetherivorans]ETT26241.1 hypothetical protein RR21198_3119 [Rhodococcus rhodochrous ATCC 21198]NGP25908.1 hypothetical protein [Rhodococcus aetherivorans]
MTELETDPPDDGDTESFFEQVLAEAAGPFSLDLDGRTVVVDVPAADGACALDTAVTPTEQLDALVGEDLADDILDVYEERPVSELVTLIDKIRAHFGLLVPPLGGFLRLVETLDLYGEAIERDLIDRHLNLYDWVREHEKTPWDKLFRFLERPIEGGYYTAALAADLELAERHAKWEAEHGKPAGVGRPSLVGWTRDRDTDTAILETLRRIEAAVFQASPKFKGRGPKTPRPLPRPLTARERYEKYRLYVEHDDIASKVLGSRYKRLSLPDPTHD